MSDDLQDMLEAYDRRDYPFNATSDAHDLRKELDPQISEAVATALDKVQSEIGKKFPDMISEYIGEIIAKHWPDAI